MEQSTLYLHKYRTFSESIFANSLLRYWNRALGSENVNDFSSYRITGMTDDGMGRTKGISDVLFCLSYKKKDVFYTVKFEALMLSKNSLLSN